MLKVVNLLKLPPPSEHPHSLSDRSFDALFTKDKPIIFAFHGNPWMIHRLTYRRTNLRNLHVRGYKEERDDDHAVRQGGAKRPRPLPPVRRLNRRSASTRSSGGLYLTGDPGTAYRLPPVLPRSWRRYFRTMRLEMGPGWRPSQLRNIYLRRHPLKQ